MTIKTFLNIAAISVVSTLSLQSCESFTDIDQKGTNLLSKTSDLELLLNRRYSLEYTDMGTVNGDMIDGFECGYIPSELEKVTKSTPIILLTLDEQAHASVLPVTNSNDGYYSSCYQVIGRVCNPILSLADEAEGPQEHKNRLKAEAYAMRAFFEYAAAQKYARVYNPATADAEMCVPIVPESWDIQIPTTQSTQKEVYAQILSDLDNAISLDALPEVAINRMRFCAAMPYAVKAHVLMSIHDYDGAALAASEALKRGDVINDYADYLVDDMSTYGCPITKFVPVTPLNLEENYFASSAQINYNIIMPSSDKMIEDGSYMKDNLITTLLSGRGSYFPGDLVSDSLEILKRNETNYGVPYNVTSDLESTHNQTGIKTTHMYLILAECAINKGRIDEAMGYLDKIRVKRIAPAHYRPLLGNVTTKTDAIAALKKTVHGEYCYSIWNFITCKRWTILDDYKETRTRELLGKTYTLTPESDMWVFPFPVTVISQNPNIKNNYTTK
ncbi:RagB/SusD family nutrient uptake outer membrane protein [uncultured Duncaniella sp.]|uniref:RagB/SusD family nutrient uptake outer membrane protein n=1 Tax=uncultured Duncaniella sp. TaxID=2768039 RepID=UPI00265A1D40|nr:RagB/SusD family nutrient uptake outer membrane protein [uncultured Duncaniella sp.]